MKKHLLTLALACATFVSMAQVAKDTSKTGYTLGSGTIFGGGGYITVDTSVHQLRSDTVKVWFKEIKVNNGNMDTMVTNGYANLNNAVQEFWQAGFQVSTWRPRPVIYLYSDRKTKVTNTVIYSIPRK